MTLTELIATLGPVGGVALFMWLNRGPQTAEKPDPVGQKLDAIISTVDATAERVVDMQTDIAVIKDRGAKR